MSFHPSHESRNINVIRSFFGGTYRFLLGGSKDSTNATPFLFNKKHIHATSGYNEDHNHTTLRPSTVGDPNPDGLCKRHMCNRKSTISIPAQVAPLFCRWVKMVADLSDFFVAMIRKIEIRRCVSVWWVLTGLFDSWYM